VQSRLGKGTTFKVYFPRFVDPHDIDRNDDESDAVPNGTETVLLVEDDPTLRTLAERVLTKCGYVVLAAAGGEEALAIASNSETLIDAIVTDVVMPGINGRELVERLAESRPGIATLLMSGYNDDQVLQRGVMHGETAFLQKPFSADQFARKVRGVLDRAS
jgi:two-component system cell cycle sensor histidine kinase/response regulator CckA